MSEIAHGSTLRERTRSLRTSDPYTLLGGVSKTCRNVLSRIGVANLTVTSN